MQVSAAPTSVSKVTYAPKCYCSFGSQSNNLRLEHKLGALHKATNFFIEVTTIDPVAL